MSNFDKAFEELLGNEGGYVNHPDDPGGETNWGITKRTARSAGYKRRMEDLSVEQAKEIYRELYWNDYLDNLPYIVAFNVFDAGVNHGVKQAIKFLQRAIGVNADGYIGSKTFGTTMSLNPYQVVALFNSERLHFYTGLHTFKTFGKGWTNRIADNLKVA